LWDDSSPTYFFISDKELIPSGKFTQTTFVTIDYTKNVPEQVITALFNLNIQSLIIEGGKKTLQSFIDSQLWDEARIFTSAQNLGGGTHAPVLRNFKFKSQERIASDTLNYYQYSEE